MGLVERVRRALGVAYHVLPIACWGRKVVCAPSLDQYCTALHAGSPVDVVFCLLGPVDGTPMACGLCEAIERVDYASVTAVSLELPEGG